jgi:hypothetical protein
VTFNFGMHDGPSSNDTIPGQNGPSELYLGQLSLIVEWLQSWSAEATATTGKTPQLVFLRTTPFLCNATSDGNIQAMNNGAAGIMAAAGIPTVDPYTAIVGHCGPAPQPAGGCGIPNCWCPHCPQQYPFLGGFIAAALRPFLA